MNSERPVFIPFVYGLAAKLEQIPLAEITSDASYYAHSLEDACELFKYDGIVNNFDSTIEAELCGCEPERHDDYAAPRITSCRQVELFYWKLPNVPSCQRAKTLLSSVFLPDPAHW